MVISLLVLLVPVVLLIGGYQLLAGRNQPTEVDPAPALAQARAAGLAVAEPTGLSADWTPVSAVVQPADKGTTLRIGYLTPAGASVQVLQSNIPAEHLLPEEFPDAGPPAGTVTIADHPWQVYSVPHGQALVRLTPELTTIVRGSAAEAELHALVAAVTAR